MGWYTVDYSTLGVGDGGYSIMLLYFAVAREKRLEGYCTPVGGPCYG